MKKIAIIAGATGAIGQSLLLQLSESKQYQVIYTLGRRRPENSNENVVSYIVSFEDLSSTFKQIPIKQNDIVDVFCTLGSTIKNAGSKSAFKQVDYNYIVNLGKISKKYHVSHFAVVSAIGANANSPFFYNQVKGEMEQALIDMNFSNLTIFRPSLLYGTREVFRLKETISYGVFWLLSPLFQGKYKRYSAININSVALALMKVAEDKRKGVYIYESHNIEQISKTS